MAMTERRRRMLARSFDTLSDSALTGLAEDFKRSGDTELNDMVEAAICARRATEGARRASAMDENEHIPFEDKIIAYETEARALRALAPLVRCCFCGVERDDPRARLVCVAPTNATAFHHFSEPAPASRLAALDNLSYAADRLDETAALLRAIAAECTGVAPCYCPAERAAAVPEREPGMCDLCGGRKLDAVDAVRR